MGYNADHFVALFRNEYVLLYDPRTGNVAYFIPFACFSLFIYYTPQFYKRVKFKTFAWLGVLAGLIVLIRPTNSILLLYLVLYNVFSWSDLKARFRFFWRHFWTLPIIPFFSFLVFIPQMYYWYYMSGDLIYYSYGNQGFSNWKNPKVLEVLFHIKNGWLLFSPMAGIGLIGAFVGSRRK